MVDFNSCVSVKQSNGRVNLLASLSEIYHTSEDDLKRSMEVTYSLIIDILKKNPCCASGCKTENLDHIDTGKKIATAIFSIVPEASL